MRKTRKIISLILVLSMVLALSACGSIKLHSDRVDFRIKGNGKKLVKLTVWGEFPEDMEKEVRITSTSEGKDPIAVTVKKDAKSKVVYEVRGLESCDSSLIIKYTAGTENFAVISMPVGVTSDLKVNIGSVILDANEEYEKLPGSDTGAEDGKVDGEISASSGDSKTIKLNAGEGSWKIESYDEAVITVDDYGYADGFSNFSVIAKAVGVSDLILANKAENKQLKLSFAVTEEKNDAGEQTGLTLTLTGSKVGDYEGGEGYTDAVDEYRGHLESIFGKAFISENARIEDFALTKFSGEKVNIDYENIRLLKQKYVIAAETQIDKTEIEKQLNEIYAAVDTAEMQLSMDGHDLFYTVTKAMGKDEIKASMFEGLEFAKEGSLSTGGRNVDYGISTDGFGVAFWTEGDATCMMTFAEEISESSLTELLDAFF